MKTIQEIAFAPDLGFDMPEGMEPYLDETAYYDTPNCTWPLGRTSPSSRWTRRRAGRPGTLHRGR